MERPTKVEVSDSLKLGFGLVWGAGFGFVVLLVVVTIFGGRVYDKEIRHACQGHSGVANTRSIEWQLSQSGSVAITCRDGYFTTR